MLLVTSIGPDLHEHTSTGLPVDAESLLILSMIDLRILTDLHTPYEKYYGFQCAAFTLERAVASQPLHVTSPSHSDCKYTGVSSPLAILATRIGTTHGLLQLHAKICLAHKGACCHDTSRVETWVSATLCEHANAATQTKNQLSAGERPWYHIS